MADPYQALAQIYRTVGLGDESERLRQRVFDWIQSEGWLGRRILELGSGVGDTACWFSQTGFRVTAVEQSDAMLNIARQQAEEKGTVVQWLQSDMRSVAAGDDFDLVISINSLNETRSIRDLEATFQMANRSLSMGKMLLFDLATVQGLSEQWGNMAHVIYDDPDSLMVTVCSRFSFETLTNTRQFVIFQQQDGHWTRTDETHIYRGYALQSVGALLQRTGFKIQHLLDANLKVFDPNHDTTGRAIFIATKEKALS